MPDFHNHDDYEPGPNPFSNLLGLDDYTDYTDFINHRFPDTVAAMTERAEKYISASVCDKTKDGPFSFELRFNAIFDVRYPHGSDEPASLWEYLKSIGSATWKLSRINVKSRILKPITGCYYNEEMFWYGTLYLQDEVGYSPNDLGGEIFSNERSVIRASYPLSGTTVCKRCLFKNSKKVDLRQD